MTVYNLLMNYYDETLVKIEELIKENKKDEAIHIIDEELKQAYIPKDFNEKLLEYKKDLNTASRKELSDEEIVEYLKGNHEQQLFAVAYLDKKNLRDYLDVCENYLTSNGFINAKALLVESLVRQEINEEIKMNKEGLEISFIPKYVWPIEISEGFESGIKYLTEYYLKEPSKLEIAKSLLYKEAMLELPINLEESEGVIKAMNIIKYIDEAFNK